MTPQTVKRGARLGAFTLDCTQHRVSSEGRSRGEYFDWLQAITPHVHESSVNSEACVSACTWPLYIGHVTTTAHGRRINDGVVNPPGCCGLLGAVGCNYLCTTAQLISPGHARTARVSRADYARADSARAYRPCARARVHVECGEQRVYCAYPPPPLSFSLSRSFSPAQLGSRDFFRDDQGREAGEEREEAETAEKQEGGWWRRRAAKWKEGRRRAECSDSECRLFTRLSRALVDEDSLSSLPLSRSLSSSSSADRGRDRGITRFEEETTSERA